jgi:protein gp37
MGKDSEIAWTDHTFNPWWGCARVSPGCEHCYAETLAARFGTKWGTGEERRLFGDKHWREPLAWNASAAKRGVRERVFCSSMADVFEDRRDLDAQRERLWELIAETPSLDWLLLTKRPQHIATMLPATLGRANVWLGVTAEDQRRANERIAEMLRHDAAQHFVSYEPALGPVDFTRLDFASPMRNPSPNDPIVRLDALRGLVTGMDEYTDRRVSWVIVGGESGPGAWLELIARAGVENPTR